MHQRPIPDSYWVSPSQLLAGAYPSERRAAAARHRLTALLDAGIRSFVDLTETGDGLVSYDAAVKTLAVERGHDVAYRRMAIPDMGVPTSAQMAAVLDHVGQEIGAGRAVYLHCWGGIGRTGTVVGCWLVAKEGRTALQALERIAELREGTPDGFKHSPETHEQREFIVRWACAQSGKTGLSFRDRCDALLKFAPYFNTADSFAALVSPVMSDGSVIMPYCELAPWATDFIQTIEDAGWCVDCDWEGWQEDGCRYVENATLVANADADVLTKLLTLHVRLDRCRQGHLADMAERGHLKAILERLKELRDQHPGG
jgi:hypothetical protein